MCIRDRDTNPFAITPEDLKEITEDIMPYWQGKTVEDSARSKWSEELNLRVNAIGGGMIFTEAVGMGHRAAESIHLFLSGEQVSLLARHDPARVVELDRAEVSERLAAGRAGVAGRGVGAVVVGLAGRGLAVLLLVEGLGELGLGVLAGAGRGRVSHVGLLRVPTSVLQRHARLPPGWPGGVEGVPQQRAPTPPESCGQAETAARRFSTPSEGVTPAASAARWMYDAVMLAESPWLSFGVSHPQLAPMGSSFGRGQDPPFTPWVAR